MLIKASAPGSLMLFGEYAVLHGHTAIVCAIDKRIRVSLAEREDTLIELISALGRLQINLHHLEIQAPFQFVLAVLKKYQPYFKKGYTLSIESDFSAQVGFASSAAVTVATLFVIKTGLGLPFSKKELLLEAREVIRRVQGVGSGADVAASVMGGVIAYSAETCSVVRFATIFPLTVVYSGSKTKTAEAISIVEKKFSANPSLFKQLIAAIGECSAKAADALQQNNPFAFAKMMSVQQDLMDALGVNTPVLKSIVDTLIDNSQIRGAKISGSGFGDCVVAVGSMAAFPWKVRGVQQIPVSIETEGVRLEKI